MPLVGEITQFLFLLDGTARCNLTHFFAKFKFETHIRNEFLIIQVIIKLHAYD